MLPPIQALGASGSDAPTQDVPEEGPSPDSAMPEQTAEKTTGKAIS